MSLQSVEVVWPRQFVERFDEGTLRHAVTTGEPPLDNPLMGMLAGRG